MRKNELSEQQRARKAGYTEQFIFRNGRICSLEYPEQTYAVCQVVVGKHFCLVHNHFVYRIETPAGKKGTATRTP